MAVVIVSPSNLQQALVETKEYIDSRDSVTLQAANSYTDSQIELIETGEINALTESEVHAIITNVFGTP